MIGFLTAVLVALLVYRIADRKGWKFTIHIGNSEEQYAKDQEQANRDYWKWKVGTFHWPD